MDDERVETSDLIVFLTVARTGSLAAAAESLRLATPSVSTRMSALERKLASELFVRSKRGSILTPAGHRLVPYARRCLALLEEAHQAVDNDHEGRLVVAAPASLGASIFSPILRILSDASQQTHCRVAHSEEVVDFLLNGTADVGLVLNRTFPSAIHWQRLCRSRLLPICQADHPLARRASVSVDDLSHTSIVVYRWSADAAVLASHFAHPRRSSDHPVQLVGLPAVATEMAIECGYIAIVPAFAAVSALQNEAAVELPLTLPGWSLDVQLAYRKDASTTTAIKSLLDATDSIRSHLEAPDET